MKRRFVLIGQNLANDCRLKVWHARALEKNALLRLRVKVLILKNEAVWTQVFFLREGTSGFLKPGYVCT